MRLHASNTDIAQAPPPVYKVVEAKVSGPVALPESIGTTRAGYRRPGRILRATGTITELAERVRSAKVGERNHALNAAAFEAAKNGITPDEASRALGAAAREVGLERGEIDGTIESGWLAGYIALASREEPSSDSTSAEQSEARAYTLADIEVTQDLPQLVPPFLAPEGVTVIYGRGGVGKGMLSIWLVMVLIRTGYKVMLVDYEGHPKEWAKRAHKMGFTDAEKEAVQYRAPFGKQWNSKTRGALHEVVDLLAREVQENAIDYLIIDSFTTSTSTGDGLGGKDAAQEFFTAVERIGVPAAVIAHVAGASGRFPDRPFGSVFVHNLARETWAMERTSEGEVDIEFDIETHRLQPKVMSLELRNMKKSDGEQQVKPEFIAFSFYFDGHIEVNRDQPEPTNRAALFQRLLQRMGKSTIKALCKAVKDETGDTVSEENARTIIGRNRAMFTKDETAVPTLWGAA